MHSLLLTLLPTATTAPDDSSLDAVLDDATVLVTDVTGMVVRIVVTIIGGIVVALILRHLIHKFTLRVLKASEPLVRFGGRVATRTANVSLGGSLVERREQRAETLNSVLGSAVNVLVGSTVALLVMRELGWDIAPLLTSVGVVGVALAFGAQSLVKDVLSGIFLMLEDQYGIGDVVDLGTTSGTVEAVGLRVTRIRDAEGTLWYHRNGEILRVGNQSQGWSRAVVDVRPAVGSDLKRTREVVLAAGAGLTADPDYSDVVIGQAMVTLVDDPTAQGGQLRLTVKTAPGEQGEVATELRRRVRQALDEAGVPLAS